VESTICHSNNVNILMWRQSSKRTTIRTCKYRRSWPRGRSHFSLFTLGALPALPQLLHGDVLVFPVQVAVLVGLLLLHVFYYELGYEGGQHWVCFFRLFRNIATHTDVDFGIKNEWERIAVTRKQNRDERKQRARRVLTAAGRVVLGKWIQS